MAGSGARERKRKSGISDNDGVHEGSEPYADMCQYLAERGGGSEEGGEEERWRERE